MRIGITERGDAAFSRSIWLEALSSGRVDGAILITKNPTLLLPLALPLNTIVHCTITGYGSTALEPNVPPSTETVPAYEALVKRYGSERIVLRIDPINPYHAEPAFEVAEVTERGRIRISFLDLYPHVRKRFKDAGYNPRLWDGFHAPLEIRKHVLESIQVKARTTVEVCGEPGLPCSGCVSDRDLRAMGIQSQGSRGGFQRPNCMCLAEKVELLNVRGQCKHGCLYCYWK